jgi:hypothetical protein
LGLDRPASPITARATSESARGAPAIVPLLSQGTVTGHWPAWVDVLPATANLILGAHSRDQTAAEVLDIPACPVGHGQQHAGAAVPVREQNLDGGNIRVHERERGSGDSAAPSRSSPWRIRPVRARDRGVSRCAVSISGVGSRPELSLGVERFPAIAGPLTRLPAAVPAT